MPKNKEEIEKQKQEEKNLEKVAAIRCSSYNHKKLDIAVKKALNLINFQFPKNKTVLIKPNIVGTFPKKQIATTTHPALIESVCKILKEHRCKIIIGESSFMNTDDNFASTGIDKIAKKYGKLVIFEQDKLIKIKNKKNKVLKQITIAKTLKDVDLIINMPKLKTHILTKYTGAIKNLYGVIPGGMKQKLHNKAKGEKQFSELLVDIYQNILPQLNIIDGIIGMEGHGPTSGDCKKAGFILASKNSVALDIASCHLMGINPKTIYPIKYSIQRKLYPNYKFQLVGIKKLPNLKFKKAPKDISRLRQAVRQKDIVCNTTKCIQCKACYNKCPVKAISMKPFPTINKKKCIRCFCCMEICPQDALSLK